MKNVHWHLGLGDAIACAPIIARLAERDEETSIPCYKHNYESISSFFYLYPNIVVYTVNDDREFKWGESFFLLGHYDESEKQLPSENFIQWFYRVAKMDLRGRKKYCPLLEASKYVPQIDTPLVPEYIFIHDDIQRGFVIDREKAKHQVVFKPIMRNSSILEYANNLKRASEIHCIDSSFLHLAETLPTTGKLFYHKYARPHSTDYTKTFQKEWTVIE